MRSPSSLGGLRRGSSDVSLSWPDSSNTSLFCSPSSGDCACSGAGTSLRPTGGSLAARRTGGSAACAGSTPIAASSDATPLLVVRTLCARGRALARREGGVLVGTTLDVDISLSVCRWALLGVGLRSCMSPRPLALGWLAAGCWLPLWLACVGQSRVCFGFSVAPHGCVEVSTSERVQLSPNMFDYRRTRSAILARTFPGSVVDGNLRDGNPAVFSSHGLPTLS